MAGSITDSTSASGGTSGSSFTINYPTTVNAGETLVLVCATDGDDDVTFDAAWDIPIIQNQKRGALITLNVYAAKAAGTEGGGSTTATVALGDERFSYAVFSLAGLADPDATAPEGTASNGNDTSPDPPNEVHGAADVGSYYFLACCAINDDGTFTVDGFPAGYGDTGTQIEGDSNAAAAAWGFLNTGSNTENPGGFTISTNRQWVAATVGFLATAEGSTGSSKPRIGGRALGNPLIRVN